MPDSQTCERYVIAAAEDVVQAAEAWEFAAKPDAVADWSDLLQRPEEERRFGEAMSRLRGAIEALKISRADEAVI